MMSLEIGERRRVEAELREAETRYRMLVEDLPAVVYSWEMNWLDGDPTPGGTSPPTRVPPIADMLGFTPDEWMRPEFWRQRVHPHDRDRVDAEADRCIADRRAAQPRVPLPREGRWGGVGLGPRDPAVPRRAWPPPPLPGGHARHHRTQGGRDEGHRSRSVVQAAHRGEPRDHVGRVRPRSRSRRAVASLLRESSQPRAVRVSTRGLLRRRPRDGSPSCTPTTRLGWSPRREDIWRTGEPWSSDFRFIHADGRVIWFHAGRPCRRLRRRRAAHRLPGRHPGHRRPQARARSGSADRRNRLSAVLDGMPALPWTEVIDPLTGALALRVHGPAERSRCSATRPRN